jgi:hypothetical protein
MMLTDRAEEIVSFTEYFLLTVSAIGTHDGSRTSFQLTFRVRHASIIVTARPVHCTAERLFVIGK